MTFKDDSSVTKGADALAHKQRGATEFTPGPWRWKPAKTMQTLVDASGKDFAVVNMPIPMGPVWKADAALIAAAPDLLEALERLCAFVPEPELVSMGYDSPPEHRTMEEHELGYALHLARAAIAKAKS